MKDKLRGFLGFLGLIEDEYGEYGSTGAAPARPFTDTHDRRGRAGVDRATDVGCPTVPDVVDRAPRPCVPRRQRRDSSISVLDSSGQAARVRPMASAPRAVLVVLARARRRDLRAAQLRRVASHHRPPAIESRGRLERQLGRPEPRSSTGRLRLGYRLRAEREDRDPRQQPLSHEPPGHAPGPRSEGSTARGELSRSRRRMRFIQDLLTLYILIIVVAVVAQLVPDGRVRSGGTGDDQTACSRDSPNRCFDRCDRSSRARSLGRRLLALRRGHHPLHHQGRRSESPIHRFATTRAL